MRQTILRYFYEPRWTPVSVKFLLPPRPSPADASQARARGHRVIADTAWLQRAGGNQGPSEPAGTRPTGIKQHELTDSSFATKEEAPARLRQITRIFSTGQSGQVDQPGATGALQARDIRIGMDRKGLVAHQLRALSLWKPIKYEEVYPRAVSSIEKRVPVSMSISRPATDAVRIQNRR